MDRWPLSHVTWVLCLWHSVFHLYQVGLVSFWYGLFDSEFFISTLVPCIFFSLFIRCICIWHMFFHQSEILCHCSPLHPLFFLVFLLQFFFFISLKWHNARKNFQSSTRSKKSWRKTVPHGEWLCISALQHFRRK